MKIRLSTILSLTLAAGAGFILFQTSQNVQQAERDLRNVQTALAKEQDAMRVLETEWDYLNRPDRLEDLARQHLKMEASSPAALVGDSGDLPDAGVPVVPLHKPALKIQPAVMKAENSDHSVPANELPMPAPVTNDARQQFNTLLDDLTRQEPASGGGAP
ncbi:MAG: cell division protein FtsL [Micavibrio sp.]